MDIGDAHQVVVFEGFKDLLADLAVQDLKEVVYAGVLIGHLEGVHQGRELGGSAGGYAGEVQTTELALLNGGALITQLTGEVALNGDAAIGFLVHQVGKHLAGLAGNVFSVVAVRQAQNNRFAAASAGSGVAGRGCAASGGVSAGGAVIASAAGAQGQQHDCCQQNCKNFLHTNFSSTSSYFGPRKRANVMVLFYQLSECKEIVKICGCTVHFFASTKFMPSIL